jgi:hypothetical protein
MERAFMCLTKMTGIRQAQATLHLSRDLLRCVERFRRIMLRCRERFVRNKGLDANVWLYNAFLVCMMDARKKVKVRGHIQRAAAPEGGAQKWVRGCAFSLLCLSTPLSAQSVPSGQDVTLYDALLDEVGAETWLRLRFVTPAISRDGGTVDFPTASADIEALCSDFALDYVATHSVKADKIAISFSDRETPFGVANPDVTQFIEVFALQDGRCIWEAF